MTEAEQGAEWVERLASDACALGEPLCRNAADHDKLRSCATGYAAAAAAFRAAAVHARAALRAALQHTVTLWAHHLVDPSVDLGTNLQFSVTSNLCVSKKIIKAPNWEIGHIYFCFCFNNHYLYMSGAF